MNSKLPALVLAVARKLLIEGKEIPGAIFKDSVAVLDKGSLTVGTARR